MSNTYDRRDGMQRGTRQNGPASRPAMAPGKRTLTQGLSRGVAGAPAPVQQERAPIDQETRKRDAARRQRDAETQRWMGIATRPDLYLDSGAHDAGEEPSASVVQQESTGASSSAAPAAPAVQLRSVPGSAPAAAPGATPATASSSPAESSPAAEGSAGASADDEAAIDAAGAAEQAALADEVETLLSRPDPVAGIGTPQDALRVLAGLPMGKLLGTLDVLEQRGRLTEILPFVDGGDADEAGRIRIALLTRELANMDPAAAQGAPLDTVAAAVERMPADEQYGVYHYLIARRQPSLDLEMLLEGALAMQSALVEQSEAVPDATRATGTMAGAAMPAPIEPGPWARPGNQPDMLYRGNAAHDAIAKHYADKHRGETVWRNSRPIKSILVELAEQGHQVDLSRLTRQELDSKPDILNGTRLCLYEIKPKGAASAGQSQASLYIGALGKAGLAVSLGPSEDPGTSGQLSAPLGVFIFRSTVPGVIEYEYRQGRLVPVPIPVTGDARQAAPERSWSWELQPLTPEQQRVLATATAGAALLVLAMILLAPIGI